MRTRNSIVNLAVSLGAQGFNILLQFLSRFIFVRYFSEEYLGVNGLFTEILTIFSLAELGIGVSMMYGLYNVIAKKDQDEISRLMNLYRRMYALVGGGGGRNWLCNAAFSGIFYRRDRYSTHKDHLSDVSG